MKQEILGVERQFGRAGRLAPAKGASAKFGLFVPPTLPSSAAGPQDLSCEPSQATTQSLLQEYHS